MGISFTDSKRPRIILEGASKGVPFAFEAVAQVLVSFLLLASAARVLSLEQFGALAFITAIAGVQQPIVAFGTQQIVYGRAAARPNRQPFLNWSAVVATGVIGSGAYLLTLALFLAFAADQALIYALAGLRVLGAIALPMTFDAQARHATSEYIRLRGITLAVAGFLILPAWASDAPAYVFAAIYGLEPFAYGLLLFVSARIRRRLIRPQHPRYRALLAKSAPMAFQSIMVAFYYRFDQIYVQFRFGEVALAQYATAARLAELGNIAFGVAVLVLAPPLIREIQAQRRVSAALRAALWGIAGLTLAASLLSVAIGSDVLSLTFGAAFSGGSMILAVYVLSTAFVAYGALAARTLTAQGKTGVQASTGLVGAGVNVVAVMALCETFGLVGAAWGTVLAYGATAAFLWAHLLFDKKNVSPLRIGTHP